MSYTIQLWSLAAIELLRSNSQAPHPGIQEVLRYLSSRQFPNCGTTVGAEMDRISVAELSCNKKLTQGMTSNQRSKTPFVFNTIQWMRAKCGTQYYRSVSTPDLVTIPTFKWSIKATSFSRICMESNWIYIYIASWVCTDAKHGTKFWPYAMWKEMASQKLHSVHPEHTKWNTK